MEFCSFYFKQNFILKDFLLTPCLPNCPSESNSLPQLMWRQFKLTKVLTLSMRALPHVRVHKVRILARHYNHSSLSFFASGKHFIKDVIQQLS